MANRPLVLGGVAVAGVAGYYLYSAGGNAKVAKKEFERTLHSSYGIHYSNQV
jgi:hypothetical protein